ncbi:hypothetical protein CCACVL1_13646, partial [Corchorus capsularis]
MCRNGSPCHFIRGKQHASIVEVFRILILEEVEMSTQYYLDLDENVLDKLTKLTVPKLCIQLNTFQYFQKQVALLEDGIRKSWELARPNSPNKRQEPGEILESDALRHDEAVDELFVTTFNIIRDTANDIGRKIC